MVCASYEHRPDSANSDKPLMFRNRLDEDASRNGFVLYEFENAEIFYLEEEVLPSSSCARYASAALASA